MPAMELRPPLPPPFPRALHDEAVCLLMERFDADSDGKLDATEAAAVKQFAAALFARKKKAILDRYDLNRDGKLDEREEAQLKRDWEREHPGIGRRVRIHMVRMRRAERAEFFSRFDLNKDGVLDEAERRALQEWQKMRLCGEQGQKPPRIGLSDGGVSPATKEPGESFPKNATGGHTRAHLAPRKEGACDRSPRSDLRARGIPPEAGIVLEYLLLERYDTDKDGVLSPTEIRNAMKAPAARTRPAGGDEGA